MKLKRICIKQFANIVGEHIDIDRKVTVLVGKNEIGKTYLLRQLLEQTYSQGGVNFRSASRLPNIPKEERAVSFSMFWDVQDDEKVQKNMARFSNRSEFRTLEIGYDYPTPNHEKNKSHSIFFDTQKIDCLEPDPNSPTRLILNKEMRGFLEKSLPRVIYFSLPESQFPRGGFEFKLFGLTDAKNDTFVPIEERISSEEILLNISGFKGSCRRIIGVEEVWSPSFKKESDFSPDEIQQRFDCLSKEITVLLKKWWQDPLDLTFSLKIAGDKHGKEFQRKIKSYLATYEISDKNGLPHFGTGLRWFLGFLIRMLYLQKLRNDSILVLDEPANNLHPSAQKIMVNLINEMAKDRQIIYSTHSPFMIDWRFPQRIRVLKKTVDNPGVTINNKPYHIDESSCVSIWDDLMISIGAPFGDIGVLGNKNVFVEGISDQILLANISSKFEEMDKPHLDLSDVSIIPFEKEELPNLIKLAKKQGRKIAVLLDSDESGRTIAKKLNDVPIIFCGEFIKDKPSTKDCSIEDLVGEDTYLKAVNNFYSTFASDWFRNIETADLNKDDLKNKTLGKKLEEIFENKFGKEHKFNKSSVACKICEYISEEEKIAGESEFTKLFLNIDEIFKVS